MARDEAFDPEAAAEDVATSAYKRILYRKTAMIMVMALGCVMIVLCDYAFLLLALWRVPPWLIGFMASFLIAEVTYASASTARARRATSAARSAITDGDKMDDAIDRMRKAQDNPILVPWRSGIRSTRFWRWLAMRSAYSACAAVVLTALYGIPAGIIAAAAYTATAMAVGSGTGRSVSGISAVLTFIDPRQPRDTPES